MATIANSIPTFLRRYKHVMRSVSALPSRQVLHRVQSTAAIAQSEDSNAFVDPLWDSAKPFDEIPGPQPLPIIGNVWRFLPKIGEFGEAGSMNLITHFANKYGPICVLKGIPGKPAWVFIYDAEAVEKVFRNEGLWPERPGVESLQVYRELRPERFDGAYGLGSTNGKNWADFRHAVNQTMMKPRSAKQYIGPIDNVTADFIDRIRLIRDENKEMPDDFNNELAKWALESITLVALDTRLGCLRSDLPEGSETRKMIESVQAFFDCLYLLDVRPSLWKLFPTPAWNRLVRVLDYFYGVCLSHIEPAMERLKALPPEKVTERELSVLETLLLKNDNPKIAVTMALDMIAAGIDTTSNSSSTTMFYLAKNPDKQEKLREELDRVLESKDTPITADKLESMKYLRACIKESMRIEPIVFANGRASPKDLVLMGYQIPRGTQILTVNSVLSNDERYFARPTEFIPERWLPDKKYDDLRCKHAFAYMPFGFGPRMCIGRRFAELEMEILLAKIFRNFKVEWHQPEPKRELWLFKVMTSPLKFRMIDRN